MGADIGRAERGDAPTVHLVASGGGHLELLNAVRGAFGGYRRVWVVDAPRADRLRHQGERVHALPQYDRHPLRGKLLQNAALSLALVLRERPKLVITSGAGGTVPFSFLARLLGAKLVFVETMARVAAPSASGRVLSRLASEVLVQWPEAVGAYPGARLCRPALLEAVRSGEPSPGRGTFVAVGTHTQPFDRLMRLVDRAAAEGLLPQPIVAQVGTTNYPSRSCQARTRMSPDEVELAIHRSRYVVCHAGSGLVSAALRAGRRPLVLPRLSAHGEHFNDHQVELADKLCSLGAVVRLSDRIGRAELDRADAPLPELAIEGTPSVGETLEAILRARRGSTTASSPPPTEGAAGLEPAHQGGGDG
jgi:UDP-N-acetylglucosamine--N-acetylmuramyl-(pentapeptide) pyrophosphoryl-undecaprenol N-acetylglucosamine transferase